MILEVKNISFAYAGAPTLFSDISFSVNRGQIISIIGPNEWAKQHCLTVWQTLLHQRKGKYCWKEKI